MAETKQVEATTILVEKLKLAKRFSRKVAFQEELIEYIQSKFAKYDIPKHELMEAVQYILIGNELVVRDEIERVYKEFKYQSARITRKASKEGVDNA